MSGDRHADGDARRADGGESDAAEPEYVAIELEDGELYVATDETTGVSSQGHSKPEALENLAGALEVYLESADADDGDWL